MYVARHGAFDPAFGAESRAVHLAAGAVEIAGDLATLRHDVDDFDDLRRALALGVGRHTRRLPVPPETH